jgi:1,4-dihydroxy-2-naphthoate octaprenyltransferase
VLKRFFAYVEIKTKIASLLPFLLALVYVLYTHRTVAWLLTGLFFLSMICFDMATTALNNYMDTRATRTDLPFSRRTARLILYALLLAALASGLALAALTRPIVLLAGAACFAVGITYTFGPAPISRMPLGEIFSGIFMGFFIPFLVVTINTPSGTLADLIWQPPVLALQAHIPGLARLALLTIPPVSGIANIMLANNICDLAEDVAIKRYTLPYYLGKRRSLQLFTALHLLSLAAIALIGGLGILPRIVLLTLLVAWPLYRLMRRFWQVQDKAMTFPFSVTGFVLLIAPQILLTALALWL